MILVFGGVYQGKLEYTLERFGFTEDEIYHCSESSTEMPANKKAVYELDKWIYALVSAGTYKAELVEAFIKVNDGCVVICNDVSCGVVPADPVMRSWREAVGRAMAVLSRVSDETVRLYCGIPSVIKSEPAHL